MARSKTALTAVVLPFCTVLVLGLLLAARPGVASAAMIDRASVSSAEAQADETSLSGPSVGTVAT